MVPMVVLSLAIVLQPPMPPPQIEVVVKGPGKTGRYLSLQASTKGELVLWRAIDPGIDFLDPILSPTDTRITGVIADNPGTYRLMAITAIDKKPAIAEFSVVFEGRKPSPPPAPPTPPPGPVDPLVAKLQAAYDRDPEGASVKAGHRTLLIGFWGAMSEHAKSAEIKTTGELLTQMRNVSSSRIAPSALVECRKLVGNEIAAAIGIDPTAQLDPTLRAPAVAVFARVAQAMSQVK